MKLKLEWALVPVVLAASAFGSDIVFSAPPELRAAIREEIVALHYAAIDASAIDDALFNEKNNVKDRASRGDYGFKPAATLPPEVQADLRSGLAGCRARTAREKSEDIKQACGEELAETVWQRYIERVRPERVIEFKKPMKIKDGFGLECATYRPTENTVAVLSPQGPALDPLLRKAVGIMLTKKLEPNGARPTSDILPEEVPPPIAELSQGVAQVLAPLKVPAGCQLPALTIGPDTAPIARTMNALWAATLVGHSSTAEPIACSIGLDAAPGERPTQLGLSCMSTFTSAEIFAGTRFGDSAFQAEMARALLRNKIEMECAPKRP